MKKTNKLFAFLMIGLASSYLYLSCSNNRTQPQAQNQVSVNYNTPQPAQSSPQNIQVQAIDTPGFNVPNFAGLLKSTSNPDALTQALNTQPNSINTLDLDGDGNIDYLRVNQLDNNNLQVVDETDANQKVVVATLTIDPQNQSYVINGTPDYCGNTYTYNSPSGITFAQMAFLTWWISPYHYHHVYHPLWGYHSHYYGGYHYYHSPHPYTRQVITERKTIQTQKAQKNLTTSNTRINTPTPAPVKSVSAPTTSQKQFNANEGNRFKAANTTNAFKPAASNNAFRPAPKPAAAKSFGGSRGFGGKRGR